MKKNLIKILIITNLMFLFYSCYPYMNDAIYIGQKRDDIDTINTDTLFLTSSLSLDPMKTLHIEEITYQVCFYKKIYVDFIQTSDLKFVTKEDYRVNTKYCEIRKKLRKKVELTPGYGYSIPLSDGWYAFFHLNDVQNPEIYPESKIAFFYKEPISMSEFEFFFHKRLWGPIYRMVH